MQSKSHWKNYVLALVITVGIFVTIIWLSRMATTQKIQSIKDAQDLIALDLSSSETEFSLLSELSCKNIAASSLSQELGSMEEKMNYTESNKIVQADELLKLKKVYFLLEIKDFLLMRKINERCGKKTTSILYVYTTDCDECTKQGYVLTALREKYPTLRIYSFDYSVELSALHALLSIYKVSGDKFPVIITGEQVYTGFQSIEDLEKEIPALKRMLVEQEQKAAADKAAAEKAKVQAVDKQKPAATSPTVPTAAGTAPDSDATTPTVDAQ